MGWLIKLALAALMALVITVVFEAAADVLGLETVLAMLLALAIVAFLARGRRG